MKRISLLLAVFILSACYRAMAQKPGELIYPEDSVTEASKKAFLKTFGQGKVLYGITCAQCHNFQEGKKQIIPDFSMPQLMDYEMRLYPIHKERLSDKSIADEEINKIILFLRFKVKSGRPFPVPVNTP